MATQLNINLRPNHQTGLWDDMTDVTSQYWNDMIDITPQFWNDMNQINWDEFTNENDTFRLSGIIAPSEACDPYLVNPRLMDSSFPDPINSSEVLSST